MPEYVVSEVLDTGTPRKAGRRFNVDFALEFEERPFSSKLTDVAVSPILPNSIGAAVDVLVEKSTLRPLLFGLMFGQSFGFAQYRPYAELVETRLHSLAEAIAVICRASESDLIGHLRFDRSGYSRLMVCGCDICFLIVPAETEPIMRGSRHGVARTPDCEVDCYIESGRIVCVDGWIAMGSQQPSAELRLVAVPESSEGGGIGESGSESSESGRVAPGDCSPGAPTDPSL